MESNPKATEEVQKKVKDLKVADDQDTDFEPWLMLEDCLEECKIDWKSPEFTQEKMMQEF